MVIDHQYWMNEALIEANKAYEKNEVPIGAIIIKNQQIIGRGFNTKESSKDVTHHAEINAIRQASKTLQNWHLDDCDLYVTVEPCAMCASAIIQSRIRNVYYGAKEPKMGAHISKTMLFDIPGQQQVNVYSGIEEEACQKLMSDFFKTKR
jgi:tRNA(adenine34) deaminase